MEYWGPLHVQQKTFLLAITSTWLQVPVPVPSTTTCLSLYRRHIYFMYPPVSAVSRDANETDKLCDMKQCSTNSKRQHIGAKRSSVAFKIRQNAFLAAVAGAPLRTPLGKLPGPPIVGCGGDTPPHTSPLSAPSAPRFSCLRRLPLGSFGASVWRCIAPKPHLNDLKGHSRSSKMMRSDTRLYTTSCCWSVVM